MAASHLGQWILGKLYLSQNYYKSDNIFLLYWKSCNTRKILKKNVSCSNIYGTNVKQINFQLLWKKFSYSTSSLFSSKNKTSCLLSNLAFYSLLALLTFSIIKIYLQTYFNSNIPLTLQIFYKRKNQVSYELHQRDKNKNLLVINSHIYA